MRGGHCKARNNSKDWHKSWVEHNRKRGPMPFDDIPEDRYRCYPCEKCGCGTIVQNEEDPSRWECTTCDWTSDSPKQ